MMSIVDSVYPEFKDTVTLLDVDVYDQATYSMLRRERLQAIPTLVFYDKRGTRTVSIGVMHAEELRARLQSLSGE
jgi:thiol:disulfide interchange protein